VSTVKEIIACIMSTWYPYRASEGVPMEIRVEISLKGSAHNDHRDMTANIIIIVINNFGLKKKPNDNNYVAVARK
jgi:hypothetical protein